MKTLYLMRHAKPVPETDDDKARPLTPEGRQDARRVGAFLRALVDAPDPIPFPDAIIASEAVRARETAEIVAAELGATALLTIEPNAYTFKPEGLLPVLRDAPDVDAVLIVAHNPALEGVTVDLVGTHPVEVRLPPGGFVHLLLDVDTWTAVTTRSARLLGLVTPATA